MIARKRGSMKSHLLKETIFSDPAASYFLKGAIEACDKRDPVDAVKDAEVLLRFCQMKELEAKQPKF